MIRRLLPLSILIIAALALFLTSCGGSNSKDTKPTQRSAAETTSTTGYDISFDSVLRTTIKVDGNRHNPSLAPQELTLDIKPGTSWRLQVEASFPDRCNRNSPDKSDSKEIALAIKTLNTIVGTKSLDTSELVKVTDEGDGDCDFKGDARFNLIEGEYYLTLDGNPQPVIIKVISIPPHDTPTTISPSAPPTNPESASDQ